MKRANKAEIKMKKSMITQEALIYKRSANSNGYRDMPENLIKQDSVGGDDSDLPYNNKQSHNLNLILKELQFITKKIKTDDEEDDKSQDWKFTAMVIDRFCLVIFVLATFISTAAILLTAKNFFKFR